MDLLQRAAQQPAEISNYLDLAELYMNTRRFDDAEQMLMKALAIVRQGRTAPIPPAVGTIATTQSPGFGRTPSGAVCRRISAPVRVGGDVKEPRKIRDVKPVYPDLARASGVSGIVILEVVISYDGTVREAKILRSVAVLDEAARRGCSSVAIHADAPEQPAGRGRHDGDRQLHAGLKGSELCPVENSRNSRRRRRCGSLRTGRALTALCHVIVDQAYNRRSWHGTNLRGSIRGVTAKDAAWRPAPGRHNIWELVVHAAYWKYTVWRRLTGAKRGSFALEGSNFFERPIDPSEKAWKADIALLDRTHRELRAAIAALPASKLNQKALGQNATNAWIISGIAAHDLYHAGQIQLLKRLKQ